MTPGRRIQVSDAQTPVQVLQLIQRHVRSAGHYVVVVLQFLAWTLYIWVV